MASDINPLYLQTLAALREDRPYLETSYCDVTDLASFPRTENGYDTVICINVIEHVRDDRAALANIKSVLWNGGRTIVLVPQGQWNFGTLDDALGHQRRYSKEAIRSLAHECGFEVSDIIDFNRLGSLAWFINGRVLRRRNVGRGQIVLLNLLTPLMRILDRLLPVPSLSLIAVMKRTEPESP